MAIRPFPHSSSRLHATRHVHLQVLDLNNLSQHTIVAFCACVMRQGVAMVARGSAAAV